jgi:uncharacterized protein YndB with AHSA1/START domain
MKNDDEKVSIERMYNVKREHVFKAWTDPEQLLKWFAPEGCTIRYKKNDIRKGGSFHSCISNPAFPDCWCKGVYTEFIFPERIEYTSVMTDEQGNDLEDDEEGIHPGWPKETKIVVTFEEVNGKTKLTLQQAVSKSLAMKTGAYPSWLQMLDRLEQELTHLV